MAARSRHAKPKSRASKVGALAVAVAALAGAAAVFMLVQGGPASACPSRLASASRSASSGSALADNLMTTAIHRASAAMQARAAAGRARAAARRRHLAERAARQRAAPVTSSDAKLVAPAGGATPRTPRSEPAFATPKKAAVTSGDQAMAAVPISSCSAPGSGTAARPANTALPGPRTRTRSLTTPSQPAARRTGRPTTAADRRMGKRETWHAA